MKIGALPDDRSANRKGSFTMKKEKGFTLLELMITLVIVAILAAIAVPSYQQYVLKSRRIEAIHGLQAIVGAMEKYFLDNNSYPSDLGALYAAAPIQGLLSYGSGSTWLRTESGAYDFNYSSTGDDGPYVYAQNSGTQDADDDCMYMSLSLSGVRGAGNGTNDTTDICWPD